MFLFVLCFNLVSAVPPSDTIINVGDNTLELKVPIFEYIENGKDYEFEIHVFNKTNGIALTSGVSCYLHLYNSTGKHIYEGYDDTVSHTFDYGFNIKGGNFTTNGIYSQMVYCNSTAEDKGAFVLNSFEVTPNGKETPDGLIVVFFLAIFIIFLIYLVAILFYGIGHIVSLDFDLQDLGYNLGGYFALLGVFMLEKQYLGNLQIEVFLNLFIEIGAITNVFFPVVAFILSITLGEWFKVHPRKKGGTFG